MKQIGIITLILLGSTIKSWGVSFVNLNSSESISISSLPTEIVLSCDVASIGNRVSCEIYHDINENRIIDSNDYRLFFQYFIDGLGDIVDAQSLRDKIGGDQTDSDGIIRSTLRFEDSRNPFGPQSWLLRITDDDQSSVTAGIKWDLQAAKTGAKGRIFEKSTGSPLAGVEVIFTKMNGADESRRAITNAAGEYRIDLTAGVWNVFATNRLDQLYKDAPMRRLHIFSGQISKTDWQMQKYESFVCGRVYQEDHTPSADISIILQNTKEFKIFHGRTDQNGNYCIGVQAGEYNITLNQYFSKYLGNDHWPEGFYAFPESNTFTIQPGQQLFKDFEFRPYQAFISGRCTLNGQPVADVLVQGIGIDPKSKKQVLFQTFSQADGAYTLGIQPFVMTSLFAQKQGLYTLSKSEFKNYDMKSELLKRDINFCFDKQATLMSLSGRLVDEQQRPVAGAYVVARNDWDTGPDGHLIVRSNDNGEYFIDVRTEGDWRIGAFTSRNSQSAPSLYFKYLVNGVSYKNLDFVLSQHSSMIAQTNGQLDLSDFYVLPHMPDPFFKQTTIDFILPHSGYTEVEVLSIDGEELVTLIDEQLSRGYQKITWDGKDDEGNIIGSGVYLCRVTSEKQTSIQPITLLK
ncbi:MAG: hypothetical protein EHM72_05775 [Calditrichaeota bacterium]|nr:MAG: hypothetical protein EHM72_05775 [Calditrichota bacterium]